MFVTLLSWDLGNNIGQEPNGEINWISLNRTVGVAPPETSCRHGCVFGDMVTGLVHKSKNFTTSDCLQYQPFVCTLGLREAHKIVVSIYKNILSKYAFMDSRGP